MNLNKKLSNVVLDIWGPTKIKLRNKNYYIKPVSYWEGVNEVLASYLLDEFKIVHPHYQLMIFENDYYVICEDLNNYGKFNLADNLDINSFTNASLYEIWLNLEEKFSNISNIMFDVIKMYIFDVLFHNSDRRNSNWGILTTYHNFRPVNNAVAVFDHGYLFDYKFNLEISPDFHEDKSYPHIYYKMSDDNIIKDNLQRFYLDSSNNFQELFTYFLNLMTPEHLSDVILAIEDKEKVITKDGNIPLFIFNKKEILENYSSYYDKLQEIWKSLKNSR